MTFCFFTLSTSPTPNILHDNFFSLEDPSYPGFLMISLFLINDHNSISWCPFLMISTFFDRSRRDLSIWHASSNRPHLEMLMSSGAHSFTNRKLRVRAFDRYHFHQIWTSPARDMGDSSWVIPDPHRFAWKYTIEHDASLSHGTCVRF